MYIYAGSYTNVTILNIICLDRIIIFLLPKDFYRNFMHYV